MPVPCFERPPTPLKTPVNKVELLLPPKDKTPEAIATEPSPAREPIL